eukprot:6262776-Pyramimonas_sp.AAC.1
MVTMIMVMLLAMMMTIYFYEMAFALRGSYLSSKELALEVGMAAMQSPSPPCRRPSSGPERRHGGYVVAVAASSPRA